MNKSDYKSAFSKIQPSDSFNERTIAYLKQNMKVSVAKTHSSSKALKYALAGTALVSCLVIAVMLLPGVMLMVKTQPTTQSVPMQQSNLSESFTTQITGQTTSQATESTQLGLDGKPVLFSSLKFAASDPMDWPDNFSSGLTDRLMLGNYATCWASNTELVVKATVQVVRFNQYPLKFKVKKEDYKSFLTEKENEYMLKTIQTVVYEIRIDHVYYADSSSLVKAGDRLVIENSLEFLDRDYPQISLEKSHQYILSVNHDTGELVAPAERTQYDAVIGDTTAESSYYMQFLDTPQIEITQDGSYLFYAGLTVQSQVPIKSVGSGWVDLINDKTVQVIMDADTNFLYKNQMKLRTDKLFETEFQTLVDKYLG